MSSTASNPPARRPALLRGGALLAGLMVLASGQGCMRATTQRASLEYRAMVSAPAPLAPIDASTVASRAR